jgi:GntR family transcriptional regulator
MADDHDVPVDPTAAAYVYMQVADRVAAQIEAGTLQPGARLPGERDLAEEYGVAIGTARRAVQELRDRGLVLTLPAKGTFIAEPQPPADEAWLSHCARKIGGMSDTPRPTPVRLNAELVQAAIRALWARSGGVLSADQRLELARLQRLYVQAVRAEDCVRAA